MKRQSIALAGIIVISIGTIAAHGQPPGADMRVRNITGDNTSRVSGIGDIVTRGPWIDARAYGADPTGARDSTASIQAAIDASIGGGRAMNRPVYLPTGSYRITRQLNFYDNKQALHTEGGILFGDGGFSSRLDWHGPAAQAVIRSIGAMHTIRDIGIYQHKPWKAAILYDGNPSIGRSTASSIERVMIHGYALPGDGIILGYGEYQSDSLTIDKCYITGLSYGNAVYLKDPNTQSCRIVNCNISKNFVGVRANASTFLGIYGGQITENNLDFWVHGVGGFDVASVRTEYSMKTFWSDWGNYAQPVTFTNVQITAVRKDRTRTIGSVKAGSDRLALSGPNFSWGDVVVVPGAGPRGTDLKAYIYGFDNATLAVLSPAASSTVRNVAVTLDGTDRLNDRNFWEQAYGPYVHVGLTFLGTYTMVGKNNYTDNITFHPSHGPQTFIGCAWTSAQPNPFNLASSDSVGGNATWIDCITNTIGAPRKMANYYRRDPIAVLESSGTPTIGFGLLFKTTNTTPTKISRFLGAVSGQAFEILVADGNTAFQNGPYLKTATGEDMTATPGVVYRFLWDNGVAHMGH